MRDGQQEDATHPGIRKDHLRKGMAPEEGDGTRGRGRHPGKGTHLRKGMPLDEGDPPGEGDATWGRGYT